MKRVDVNDAGYDEFFELDHEIRKNPKGTSKY